LPEKNKIRHLSDSHGLHGHDWLIGTTRQPVIVFISFTWILHELEAFICKALKAEAIVNYASALITLQMAVSGSPKRVRINEIK
jgi:hypothetical protein